MKRRCVICNKSLSEEEINGAIDFADWEEFGRRGGEVYDEGGQPLPPEGANCNVIYSERAGDWAHRGCDEALGTGETPEEQHRQFVEGMTNLLFGPGHKDSHQP
jgi:hypothetical protein